jgi:ribosome-associated heat shock protein Hsp15
MDDIKSVRIDKFLWSVRIYKTRSIAADACKKGKITMNEVHVKPSRLISKNEIIIVKKLPAIYTYKVLEPIENRVSAKLASKFLEDLTSDEEKAKLDIKNTVITGYRDKGTGRPTKKERRLIDRITEDSNDL